jgi:hypothetical protein
MGIPAWPMKCRPRKGLSGESNPACWRRAPWPSRGTYPGPAGGEGAGPAGEHRVSPAGEHPQEAQPGSGLAAQPEGGQPGQERKKRPSRGADCRPNRGAGGERETRPRREKRCRPSRGLAALAHPRNRCPGPGGEPLSWPRWGTSRVMALFRPGEVCSGLGLVNPAQAAACLLFNIHVHIN